MPLVDTIWNHPECQPSEVWLTNDTQEGFGLIGYATKRLGRTAYDKDGKPVQGLYPVFVSAVELNDRGNPDGSVLAAFDRAIAMGREG
jgi:hypothetical protein